MVIKRKEAGFTLIELLVVIAIIAILAAIAIPQYLKYEQRAARSSAESDAHAIATIIQAYYTDNQSYPSSTQVPNGVAVTLGDQTFHLSPNNSIVGYGTTGGTEFDFSVSNTTYGKAVTYNSDEGGIIKNLSWQ